MQKNPGGGVLLSLVVLFLLSGATSLVYQVLWVRQLSLVLGSTMIAISAVVGAFMAGLALGSAFLGSRADRWGSTLRLYAILEGGIGVCALAIPSAFEFIAQSRLASGWLPFGASFALLLIPTALMGGTLPALARFVSAFPGSRGRWIGGLYALNTLGAILGAALTGFVLIRALGIQKTTTLVACCNLGIFVVGLLLARFSTTESATRVDTSSPQRGRQAPSRLLRPVTIAYFVSGFVGLALEVLWTRAVLLFSGNTIYAFTVILTTFLLGLAVGSSIMSAFLRRVEKPPELFAALQLLIALIAGFTPLLLASAGVPLFRAIQDKALPMGLAAQALSTYCVSVAFMLPATVLMGACFPIVARIVAQETRHVGRDIGRVYALNTLGAVLGSFLASLLFIPQLGIQKSIVLFALFSAATAAYLAFRTRSTILLRTGIATVAILLFSLVLSPNSFRSMLEEFLDVRLISYAEGLETTVGVYDSPRAGRPVLLINNVALDDHGIVHKMLAHLPMLLHPAPQRGLVLGFGVGITSQSLSSHNLAVNHCVEIAPEVMEAAAWFAGLNGGIADRNDRHFSAFIADGRRFLLARPQPYDVIALDANSGKLRNAGVGKLYTREFFELCRRRLTDDGLVTAYVSPNGTLREFKMIVRTFVEVFPHTTLWMDPVYGETCVLLGSKQPLRIDMDRYMARIGKPDVQADLATFDLDHPGTLLSAFLMGEQMLRLFARDGVVNTDDRPNMEFYPLDMDLFEINDTPVSMVGLPLYQESVLPLLHPGRDHEASLEVHAYVDAAERASSSLFKAWEAKRAQRHAEALEWLRLAADIHPQAEYLRTQLGYGRSADSEALASVRQQETAANLARVALVTARRGDPVRALGLIDRALATEAVAGNGTNVRRGELHVAAARCALDLGDVSRGRAHLQQAEAFGQDAAVLRAELDFEVEGPGAAERILSTLKSRTLETAEMARVLELLIAMGRDGVDSPTLVVQLAKAMQQCGDFPGAFLAYRKATLGPSSGSSQMRALATALHLGLRLDVLRRAYGMTVDADPVLSSRFGAGRVPQSEIPTVSHTSAQAWIHLSQIHLRSGQPLKAYHLARAARAVAPADVEAYVAIAQAAAKIQGGRRLAQQALERALRINDQNESARIALQQLQSSAALEGTTSIPATSQAASPVPEN